MEAEEAERIVRAMHKAANRATKRLVREMSAPAWQAMDAAAKRAALSDILDEYNASVERFQTACDEILSHAYAHPHLSTGTVKLGLDSLRKVRSRPVDGETFRLLDEGRMALGRALARLDHPQPDDSAPIGSRPPGPGFYRSEQARAEAQRNVARRPGMNSAQANSVPDVAGPYDDLREPWYRRLLRRNRGQR
jgi:peptidoglycan/xylan/chitin deacetylase (PgdA/CDA1 family)